MAHNQLFIQLVKSIVWTTGESLHSQFTTTWWRLAFVPIGAHRSPDLTAGWQTNGFQWANKHSIDSCKLDGILLTFSTQQLAFHLYHANGRQKCCWCEGLQSGPWWMDLIPGGIILASLVSHIMLLFTTTMLDLNAVYTYCQREDIQTYLKFSTEVQELTQRRKYGQTRRGRCQESESIMNQYLTSQYLTLSCLFRSKPPVIKVKVSLGDAANNSKMVLQDLTKLPQCHRVVRLL